MIDTFGLGFIIGLGAAAAFVLVQFAANFLYEYLAFRRKRATEAKLEDFIGRLEKLGQATKVAESTNAPEVRPQP